MNILLVYLISWLKTSQNASQWPVAEIQTVATIWIKFQQSFTTIIKSRIEKKFKLSQR